MKQHIVLDDCKFGEGRETQTLCGIIGKIALDPPVLLSDKTCAAYTIAHQAHFNDKRFCNTCRHIWRRITSA